VLASAHLRVEPGRSEGLGYGAEHFRSSDADLHTPSERRASASPIPSVREAKRDANRGLVHLESHTMAQVMIER
jgi:hypothetical protein